jgi:pimeloyl-ACP methyl ester carboxylesterase
VVGFSLGGWIAAEILVKDGSRVSRLVLGAPLGLRTAERRKSQVTDLFTLEPKEVDATLQVTPAAHSNLAGLPEAVLERIARNAEAVCLFGWSPYLYNPKLHLRLHRIKAPTVLLWGEADRLAPLDYARSFVAGIEQAQLETLPGCGHRIYVDSPDLAAARIASFRSEA